MMPQKSHANGPPQILAAALLWSFGGLGIKLIGWSALSIACARGVIASGVIWLFFHRGFTRPSPAVWLGAFGILCTSALFMLSNKLTTAANAIVLQYTAPVFVILLSAVFLKARPQKADVAAVLCSTLGVALFFVDRLGQGALLGNVLALLSGLSFAGVFFTNGLPGGNPAQAAFLGNLMNLVLLPFLLTDPLVFSGGAQNWAAVILMGIFQLGLAYVLFARGSLSTRPVAASILCTIEPILSPIWVFLAFGERPGAFALAGIAIVIGSLALYNYSAGKRRTQAS